MRLCGYLIGLALWAVLLSAMPADADSKALEQEYRQQFAQAERMARTGDDRRALAQQLLGIARSAGDKQRIVFYCRKAHEIGSRNISGYLAASEALDLMQRTDPSTRLEALEKLEQLYGNFYRARSKVLPAGAAQSEVLQQIAEERLDVLEQKLDTGGIAPNEGYELISKATRDLAMSSSVLSKVIHRAKADSMRSAQQAPSISRRLSVYAEKMETKRSELDQQRELLEAKRKSWGNLRMAYQRFKAQPNALFAKQLAHAYLFDLARPEILPVAVHKILTSDVQDIITLSCKAPADLKKDQLMRLADWYHDQAFDMSNAEARQLGLLRAWVYARQAQRKDVEAARELQEKIGKALQILMKSETLARKAAHELEARLEYQFGTPPVLAVNTNTSTANTNTSNNNTTNSNTNTTNTTSTTNPSNTNTTTTNTTNAAGNDSGNDLIALPTNDNEAPVAVVSSSHSGGRKLLQCQGCGRNFFPGYGDQTQTHCPRCQSGAKNIFDMAANSEMD